MSTTETTTVNQDDTSGLKLDGLGDGIHVPPGAIAAIVILLVLALIGLIIACAYAFGGFKRCCRCCGGGRRKRLSQLPVYSDSNYLDDRDRLPAWNPNAPTTEMQGLSRMASARHGLFSKGGVGRKGTWERPLMLDDSPVNSPRNSHLTRNSQMTTQTTYTSAEIPKAPASPYLTDSSRNTSQKSKF